MGALKKNLAKILEKQNTSYNKLEKKSGLSRNYISNMLRNHSRSPSVDSVAKIATTLGVSLDELMGLPTYNSPENTKITNISLFLEIMDFVQQAISEKHKEIGSSSVFNAILSIYSYSNPKNKIDMEFADWYVKNQLF